MLGEGRVESGSVKLKTLRKKIEEIEEWKKWEKEEGEESKVVAQLATATSESIFFHKPFEV